mmetsp:Transcript_2075/g.5245  ORF Transcript_2075/g.5245 Transcript_2075/m.5245 type:complete len:113 (-) Transcript_2075:802-1140(-)
MLAIGCYKGSHSNKGQHNPFQQLACLTTKWALSQLLSILSHKTSPSPYSSTSFSAPAPQTQTLRSSPAGYFYNFLLLNMLPTNSLHMHKLLRIRQEGMGTTRLHCAREAELQ